MDFFVRLVFSVTKNRVQRVGRHLCRMSVSVAIDPTLCCVVCFFPEQKV
jgi:hypothetical protein